MNPKEVVRRFVDEYQTRGSEQAFDELIAPDIVDHSQPGRIVEHWNVVDRAAA
jgi:hypothetical protein